MIKCQLVSLEIINKKYFRGYFEDILGVQFRKDTEMVETIKREFERKIESRIRQFSQFLEGNNGPVLFEAIESMQRVLKAGNKLLVFGNGGSAAQASHLAAELVNKFYFERSGLPALALTCDMANITSIANDSDYKFIFSRQLEALGQPGDLALGITTGGTSANVLEAFRSAKKIGMPTVALCGTNTTALENLGVDVVVAVESDDTPLIQEMHLFALHMMAEVLEKNMFGG